jgi:hypothetical protein
MIDSGNGRLAEVLPVFAVYEGKILDEGIKALSIGGALCVGVIALLVLISLGISRLRSRKRPMKRAGGREREIEKDRPDSRDWADADLRKFGTKGRPRGDDHLEPPDSLRKDKDSSPTPENAIKSQPSHRIWTPEAPERSASERAPFLGCLLVLSFTVLGIVCVVLTTWAGLAIGLRNSPPSGYDPTGTRGLPALLGGGCIGFIMGLVLVCGVIVIVNRSRK